MPTVFITGASGHIGQKLIPVLLTQDSTKLVLPTSNASHLTKALPDSIAVSIIEGDIKDPQWVESKLKNYEVDTVFLCLTGNDELFTTLNIFSALERTPTIKHIIYLSACGDFNPATNNSSLHGWKSAHSVVKTIIEMTLRELCKKKGYTHTILGPTLFFDNDLRQQDAIMNGVYREPLGKLGAGRVSVDDIAEAVRIAVLDQGKQWNGEKIMLGTRKQYTEDDVSKLWSEALGKTVKCAPNDDASLDRLEEHFKEHLGAAWARDLRLMYEGIRDTGFGFADEDYPHQVAFLGREPKPYEDFVMMTAKSWKE